MYRAPLEDLLFAINDVIAPEGAAGVPDLEDFTPELAESVLTEAARFAEGVLEPLNQPGDRIGAKWTPDGVVMPPGFKDAYRQFAAAGWTQLRGDPEHGGSGMPYVIATAVEELWASANLAFKLCPMLTQGAIEALEQAASPELQRLYLPKMISGEWTGTMNLTESQAGSDLGQIRTRAVPDGDHYRVFGQKIFITYGDHDLTENTIHLVLARIEGAPAGTRGLSLFVVPKFLVNADGSLGERNDVRCVSIEHKLGIHASPTCVLAYGDQGGALACLVGEANRGLEYMFIMMNAARLSVGLEGFAMAEAAYQRAAGWARTRVQGKPPGAPPSEKPLPIAYHPDVKRMLLTMKAGTEAMRALALYAAWSLDLARHAPDAARRQAAQARGDLLIPIVKGWSTELGIEIASLGVQVHGGMGYVEETGAAQYLRDVRITTIYEGTTGIQSNDLVGRKIGRDHGAAMAALLAEAAGELQKVESKDPAVVAARDAVLEGLGQLRDATESLLRGMQAAPEQALAVSVPYLELCGTVIGGWLMAKSAAIAERRLADGQHGEFLRAKIQTAHFYGAHILPKALALARVVRSGATSVLEADTGALAAG